MMELSETFLEIPAQNDYDTMLLNRLPEKIRKRLIRNVNRYYRENISDTERKNLKNEIILQLVDSSVFEAILPLRRFRRYMSSNNSDIWSNNADIIMENQETNKYRRWYRFYDEMYSMYGLAIMDCVTTIETLTETKKVHTTYLENFNVMLCAEADEAETANRFLSHLCDIYENTIKTERKKNTRSKDGEDYILDASENPDDTEESHDIPAEDLPDSDFFVIAAEQLDCYLGDSLCLVTDFCEKHRKIRNNVSLERMFYTEELIRILHKISENILTAKTYESEPKVMQKTLQVWLDYLMTSAECKNYLQIHRTRLKSWKDFFGDERFDDIAEKDWNQEVSLLRSVSKEADDAMESTLLDYRIYEKYFIENDLNIVRRGNLSTYHRSFTELLRIFRNKEEKNFHR